MDKNKIKSFAIDAREQLMKSAEKQAGLCGITKENWNAAPIQKGDGFEIYKTAAGTEKKFFASDIRRRENLVLAIERQGFDQIMEETAYTWFNRLIAIRFMEVNHYLPTRTRVLSSETGGRTPDLVNHFMDVDLNMSEEEIIQVQTAKEENRYDDAFSLLFVKQCNELNALLPGLFEKTDDYMELLLNLSYNKDGVVRMLVDDVPERNFDINEEGQVEIIGWLYQYYNTKLKDDTFAKLKKNIKITKERIPAATQLFTPDWIVRYMVENSLGRLWLEGHPNDLVKENWKYYLEEAEQEPEVQVQLDEIKKEYAMLRPEDIKCIDPCMGSGHILIYLFDVLMQIYESEGYSQREAARSILEHNLFGLDIDKRAYQMAYFSVMMKARQYDRRILTRGIVPHVYAIEESNYVEPYTVEYFADGDESLKEDVSTLVREMHDAKEYGSILNVTEVDFGRIYERFDEIEGDISLHKKGVEEMLPMVRAAHVLAQKYDVVVTNPPYMGNNGMGSSLNEYVKNIYPDVKSDMSTVFMEKTIQLSKQNGYMSMINIPVWMFLSSYEKLRKKILNYNLIINMLHFGRGVFGSDFGTTAFVILKSNCNGYRANYYRLFEKQGAVDSVEKKKKWFLEGKGKYISTQESFDKIPGIPIAYWSSSALLEAFSKRCFLGDFCEPRVGMATANNDQFMRFWYEISTNKLGLNMKSREEALNSKKKWFPFAKGGECRKWYGNNDYVVNWEKDGQEIRNFKDEKTGRIRSHNYNLEYIFQSAITWTVISSATTSFRFCPEGFLYSNSGYGMFFYEKEKLMPTLGFLNTKVVRNILGILSPTIGFESGYLRKIPFLQTAIKVDKNVKESINISRHDWDSFETSWDFDRHPLLPSYGNSYNHNGKIYTHDETENISSNYLIESAYQSWKKECDTRFNQLKTNEEELNRIFIEIYGLQDELTPEVEEKDITVRKADLQRDIRSLISYAVGCMFGRYSLDVEGLAYAGGEWDNSKYSSFIPDADNVIPITDDNYFEDDIVGRFCEWMRIVYGEETLEENLDFVAEALGNKGSSSREIIRNYFLKDFFKDHCKIYQKRPIYWLFDSGKQNGFKALIYLHRYNRDTVGRVRSDYLHKIQDAITGALKNAEYIIETSSSAVDRAKASKSRDKYLKQLNEIRVYYQALSHVALQRMEIDLDDGVKHNYGLFQNIEVSNEDGKRQTVNLLAKI